MEANLRKEEDEISNEIKAVGQMINDIFKKWQNAVAISWVNKQNVIAVSMMLDAARKRTRITKVLNEIKEKHKKMNGKTPKFA